MKKLSEQGQGPSANPTQVWCQVGESNPGQIGRGRRVSALTIAPSLLSHYLNMVFTSKHKCKDKSAYFTVKMPSQAQGSTFFQLFFCLHRICFHLRNSSYACTCSCTCAFVATENQTLALLIPTQFHSKC